MAVACAGGNFSPQALLRLGCARLLNMTPATTSTKSPEITATRLTTHLGAEVSGIDLRDTSPENMATLNELLLEHGVLFFRDVMLDPDEHKALAQGFGTPSVFPLSRLMMPPDAEIPFLSDIIDDKDDPPNADGWHTDVTWVEEPPKIGILQAIEVPGNGGDTLWADTYAAYDALSPIMQEVLGKLTVNHQVSPVIVNAARRRGGEELAQLLLDSFPPVPHPLVCAHPETGRKTLYLGGEFMIGIDGMHEDESKTLLDWLKQYITNPNFQVRWSWSPGDLAIWDERRTNHRALSNHYPSYRHMRRCTVDGDRPHN